MGIIKNALKRLGFQSVLKSPVMVEAGPMHGPELWVATQRRTAFLNTFVQRGEMCLVVGTNAEERIKDVIGLGMRAVAVEDVEEGARLAKAVGGNGKLTVVTARLAAAERKERGDAGPGLPDATLDQVIEAHGAPAICRLNVNGHACDVLAGLSRRAGMMWLTYAPDHVEETVKIVERLKAVGYREFNYSVRGTYRMALKKWADAETFVKEMRTQGRTGDVGGDFFAR